ncbi:MAG: hypothetical protein DI534_09140 [Leifsonia xyli]|nr:MAG: hypothetical protein DI534_09140 [Leifsonia xyli]
MIFDRALSIEHARGVLDELRPLLTAKRFHARGLTQDGDRVTQWHVEVDRPARSWFLSSENGTTYEVRDGMATLGNEKPRRVSDLSEGSLGPVVLAFPERLLVWGERPTHYRPVLVQRIGQHSILITIEHGADPSMRGTIVVDTRLGLITRVMNFISRAVVLVDVEIDKPIERRAPEAFPEPDVIHPDY